MEWCEIKRIISSLYPANNYVDMFNSENGYIYLKRQKLLIPFCSYNKIATNIYKEYSKQLEKQNEIVKELLRIVRILNSENVSYLVVKGAVLSKIIYNCVNARDFGDIDIVVSQDDLLRVMKILKSHQYLQMYGWDQEPLCGEIVTDYLVFPESYDHHEIRFVRKMENIDSFFVVEIKKRPSSLPENAMEELWNETIVVEIEGIKIRTTNLLYTFISLCSNAFIDCEMLCYLYQSTITLRDYHDIYGFIIRYHCEIEIGKFVEVCYKIGIAYRIKRVLQNLEEYVKCFVGEIDKTVKLFVQTILCKIEGDGIKEIINDVQDVFKLDDFLGVELINWEISFTNRIAIQDRLKELSLSKFKEQFLFKGWDQHCRIYINQNFGKDNLKAYDNSARCYFSFFEENTLKYLKYRLISKDDKNFRYGLKIEVLLPVEDNNSLFEGYICLHYNNIIFLQRIYSDGKYPTSIGERVQRDLVDGFGLLDVTSMVDKNFEKYDKAIFRLSILRIHINLSEQKMEIGSMSGTLCYGSGNK